MKMIPRRFQEDEDYWLQNSQKCFYFKLVNINFNTSPNIFLLVSFLQSPVLSICQLTFLPYQEISVHRCHKNGTSLSHVLFVKGDDATRPWHQPFCAELFPGHAELGDTAFPMSVRGVLLTLGWLAGANAQDVPSEGQGATRSTVFTASGRLWTPLCVRPSLHLVTVEHPPLQTSLSAFTSKRGKF